MKILAIETSCDETALAIVDCKGEPGNITAKTLANTRLTQEVHSQWGGVVPNLAKREHAKNLTPLLAHILTKAPQPKKQWTSDVLYFWRWFLVRRILRRELSLARNLLVLAKKYPTSDIDAIAVTTGPGLEPALWVGINFAEALGVLWGKPVIPVNHMEGHILSALIDESKDTTQLKKIEFPALALLISGGHTQLVLMRGWLDYKLLGETRDDAVGEAFDKVARLLGLPYPGGPEISKLASEADPNKSEFEFTPPMIDTNDYDFSFSGLKTQVMYTVKEIGTLSDAQKKNVALAFEKTVTEVLLTKTMRAIEEFKIKTLVIGGGVVANKRIREAFATMLQDTDTTLLLPTPELSTDNALMIALAGYLRTPFGRRTSKSLIAEGNLQLESARESSIDPN